MAKVNWRAQEKRDERDGGVGTAEEPYASEKQVRGERMRKRRNSPRKGSVRLLYRRVLSLNTRKAPPCHASTSPFPGHCGKWSTFTLDLPFGSLDRPQNREQSSDDVTPERSLNKPVA